MGVADNCFFYGLKAQFEGYDLAEAQEWRGRSADSVAVALRQRVSSVVQAGVLAAEQQGGLCAEEESYLKELKAAQHDLAPSNGGQVHDCVLRVSWKVYCYREGGYHM